ncbi:MAG: nucleotidyl transferase AbiEii/AbiGii toxin family protein [Chloroflexi bacterium]|nr:nucleotidyl transferase AbiEii/AbiGii toxin family protein [Chloroflexota bacterium]
MKALTFWKIVVADRADFLEHVIALLEEHGIRWCVIGGTAVNAYADPVVTLDLDLVVATDQIAEVEALFRESFKVERFPHSINVSVPNSRLRVQVQTDPRYASFVERAEVRDVMDLDLPVASLEDLLQGKLWAVMDDSRRPSKRQKDLTDILRLMETYPQLRDRVPPEVRARLFGHGLA